MMAMNLLNAADAPSSAASRRHWFLPTLAALLAAAIFIFDTYSKVDIAIAVLYVAIVLMAVNFCGRRGILLVSFACMGLAVVSFAIMHGENYNDRSIGRLVVALCAIAITTFLAVRIQSATASLRRQAELLDLTYDTIFVRNMQDIVTFWNRGAEELFGWSKEEALGQSASALTQTRYPKSRAEIFAELLQIGRWEGELVRKRRDGTQVTVASRWSLQRDERGRPTAILETDTDITAAKQAEDNLAKLQADLTHAARVATLGELTASIAHEVNQPLAGVVTNGEACLRWLKRDVPELNEVEAAVQRMISDGRRASEVIKRLRTLAKKGESERDLLDMNDVIEDAIPIIHREVFNSGVSLQRELAVDLPSVSGDRVQLQQVIINLLINAVQAMAIVSDRPRELIIRSSHKDKEVLVEVQDTGPGIDSDNESKLFNAFFTTKAQGMGMGLSICRSIIEAHYGRLWASRNAATGATFAFALRVPSED